MLLMGVVVNRLGVGRQNSLLLPEMVILLPCLVVYNNHLSFRRSLLGSVKIWDLRQGNTPAAILAPGDGEPIIDPWTVSFGTSIIESKIVMTTC